MGVFQEKSLRIKTLNQYDMKKVSLIFTLLAVSILSFAQGGDIQALLVKPIMSDELTFSTDSIEVKFFYWKTDGELRIKIQNKTKERIYIEWENARFDNSRIVFGSDSRLSMKNPKADELIHANSISHAKTIMPEGWVSSDYVITLIDESRVMKKGGHECDIILPVRFSSGEVIDYTFLIHIYHFNPVDCSDIKLGMKPKEVRAIAGTPDNIFKLNGWQEWTYASNVVIKFEGGVVTKIEDMKKPYMLK